MSLSKLSKLPPEVLSSVLNNRAIPLPRRLHLRLLSNRWADIIEDGLKKETSLTIRDKKAPYFRSPEPDDLVIQSALTDEFTRPLSLRLFTSLTQLAISFGCEASWKAVPSLFAHLETTNLTTLKLYSSDYDKEQFESLGAPLNALSGLTSLTLDGPQLSVHLLPRLKPVLSRLEKFGCVLYSTNLASILSSSLSPRCTHLWLDSYAFRSFNNPFLFELSSNLTHLHLFNCKDITIWQSGIFQMHGLSSLTLDFNCYTDLDASLFRRLVPFTRLTQAKLIYLSFHTPLALPSEKETPLSTVKRLTLQLYFSFYNPSVDNTFFQAVSAWFPALVHLTIIVMRDIIPAIQAHLSQLPFSVELVACDSVDTSLPDW